MNLAGREQKLARMKPKLMGRTAYPLVIHHNITRDSRSFLLEDRVPTTTKRDGAGIIVDVEIDPFGETVITVDINEPGEQVMFGAKVKNYLPRFDLERVR